MTDWVRVCSIDDCLDGSAQEFVVQERLVAIFRVGEEFFALDGICPHQGGPLGKGRLEGCVVTCPWHGWQFDVRDGQHGSIPSLSQATLSVRLDGDDVLVELQE